MTNFTKTLAVALSATLLASVASAAGPPTFTKDVLPILQENCQDCHRPLGANMAGMIAPMSLMTYKEVRPWAKSIVRAIAEDAMPPWHADEKHHGTFSNERTLTKEEVATISNWVKSGARRGNQDDAPAPIEFSETGWNIGVPDLIVAFDEPYFVADDVEDLYHNVTVTLTEDQLPDDKWIGAIEYRPGSEVVHHIIGYALSPGTEVDGEEGVETQGMLGGMAPGSDTEIWAEGYGILLRTGSEITFAMHYHKEAGPGTGTWDQSSIGFQFHEKPVHHPIEISTVQHGAFEIPPGANNWRVGASRTMTEDTLLLSMLPHLHLRGKAARYTAIYPDGTTEELLNVPAYDFNWQTGYKYTEPKLLPAGTRIEMDLWYDNSAENAARVGFNSERAVRFGGPTTDEMDLAWINITPAAPQDDPLQAGAGD